MNYASIKALAKRNKEPIANYLALAPQNDPFYTGAPATVELAEWFAAIWERYGYQGGVHIRRVHYQIMSNEEQKPNGKIYQNTIDDWGMLCNAAKYARHMGLVPADAFVDRRNPEPYIHIPQIEALEPFATLDFYDWQLPTIAPISANVDMRIPNPWVSGYEYSLADQPIHMELWIEKSTMNDVVIPLGQRYGLNVVTSLGFQSITSIISLMQRIRRNEENDRAKPVRIFYVSDFDPAGDGMPVAVARQIEFWSDYMGITEDIALEPIILTSEQVAEYDLPSVPIKEKDRRRANFEERYNTQGAVELDALEALHPGVLAEIITAAIEPYFDEGLESRLNRQGRTVQREVREAWIEHTKDIASQLIAIEQQTKDIVAQYDDRLATIGQEMQEELQPLRKAIEELETKLQETWEDFSNDNPLEAREAAIFDGNVDEYEWLYVSYRDYLDQMEYYKTRKDGDDGIS